MAPKVAMTMSREQMPPPHQARDFGLTKRWPGIFGDTVFETFPFLQPMLCAAALTSVGSVLGFLYAPETASQWRRMHKRMAERERTAERRRNSEDGDVEAAADRRAAV